MGKGFNNYMTKKFFHPSSKENIKRVWMAQQKTEFEKKKQEDLLNQYQKEQETYQNRALLGDEKAKLGLSFMYDAPPGLKKKEDEKESETEVKFEWQRKYNAPREQYAKNDDEIRDQPFGIEVRNVRCIKCRKWGHVNTDKICPLFNKDLTAEPPQPSTSAASLLEGMKEDGFKLKQSILGRMAEDPTAEHEKLIDSGDEDDPEVKFLKSLSPKQKKKLLKKLNKLQEGKGKKSKKDKKQKKKKHRSSSVSSDSENDSPKRKKKKKKKSDSDSETDSRHKRKKTKHMSDSEEEDDRKGKGLNREDRNKSNSGHRGGQSENMARRRSRSLSSEGGHPSRHRRDSYKNGNYNKRKSESSSDSESDKRRTFNNSTDNGRSFKNRSRRSRSNSYDRRHNRSRSTSRDRYSHSRNHRSRSRERRKRSRSFERRPERRHSRSRSIERRLERHSRSRSRSKTDRSRNRAKDKTSRSRYSSESSRSRSRSGDRNQSALRRRDARSSINTPPVKGWLPSAEVTPGVKDRLGKPRTSIWIVGSSIIYWAHRRASQLRNINLGIKTSEAGIEWYGTRGMRWNALLPKLHELSGARSPPNILILYVGSNDVGYVKPKDLVSMIKTDVSRIKEMFPDTMLVYNEILSRINWRGAPTNEDGEEQRLAINKLIKPVMESCGGFMIHHPDICNINTSLYRDDGVHLNDQGYDIFNSNIENTIREALLRMQY